MSHIILHGISTDEFKELCLEAFKEMLSVNLANGATAGTKKLSLESEETFFTRQQAANYLQMSLPTLHQYTKNGWITSYRIGNKVRYKKADLETALTKRNYGRRA
ncbi:helix-turn-helix domain-containing protein [Sunxiuqinia rutila]|uniref:helix-turn-helix domain-containing protein n=1 Tax=Sunxiuqinia rutila TaxID=1397841 RepID=UPI003D35FC01